MFENLRRQWRQKGGKGKDWGASGVRGESWTCSQGSRWGERAHRGENGGREVKEEALAGIPVPGKLRDTGTVRVTWEHGVTEHRNHEPEPTLLMPPRDNDQTSVAILQAGACFRKQGPPSPAAPFSSHLE